MGITFPCQINKCPQYTASYCLLPLPSDTKIPRPILRRTILFKGLSLISFYASCLLFYLARVHLPSRDSLAACFVSKNVPFVVESSEGWNHKVIPWNVRLNYTPVAIAIPQSADQIKAAVSCGIRSGLRVSAKSGGHSFGSYGLGGEDGHLVIELDRMDRITLHRDGTARIEPGARLGNVVVELYNQGRRAISHGSCPGVGLAGHVLRGGYGIASRLHGLTLDWLIGATVVLADGSSAHCSATENTDLFWAVRGAGSSFGIVAEFEFSTFEAPNHVTPFTIDLFWNEAQAVEGFEALQDFAISAPRELNQWLFMDGASQSIQGVYFGDRNGLDKAIQPFLARIKAKVSHASTMGWIKAHEHFANGENLKQTYSYNSHKTFYGTSLMATAITKNHIKTFMSAIFANINDTSARHSWDFTVAFHGGGASAIADIDPSATAYVHRDKLLLYQFSDIETHGQYPEDGFAVLQQFRKSVTDSLDDGKWGMYANYVDTQIDVDTAQKLYWGRNLLRLQSIKTKLDPNQVFWDPSSIRPLP
ncbi:FAD-binding protein [Glarea lozoyensis ATCC 20868]|uniref:FAD-binding protein n=1 Tax=Glarea lozoyensis (strain ATCC 20868 / MF5171) TaxID=1116229 RepID=S3CN04_GLAL2|nr:FAD-binding protein [Glarea lozoyensis ATCC 20868]EPE27842.1 FAD-binding protein [Glarea lozoyensis ATCC 20868]